MQKTATKMSATARLAMKQLVTLRILGVRSTTTTTMVLPTKAETKMSRQAREQTKMRQGGCLTGGKKTCSSSSCPGSSVWLKMLKTSVWSGGNVVMATTLMPSAWIAEDNCSSTNNWTGSFDLHQEPAVLVSDLHVLAQRPNTKHKLTIGTLLEAESVAYPRTVNCHLKSSRSSQSSLPSEEQFSNPCERKYGSWAGPLFKFVHSMTVYHLSPNNV